MLLVCCVIFLFLCVCVFHSLFPHSFALWCRFRLCFPLSLYLSRSGLLFIFRAFHCLILSRFLSLSLPFSLPFHYQLLPILLHFLPKPKQKKIVTIRTFFRWQFIVGVFPIRV